MKAFFTSILLLLVFNSSAQVTADAGPDRNTCYGDIIVVSGKGLISNDTGSYTWKNASTGEVLSSVADLTVQNLIPGSYVYELTVTKTSNNNFYIARDSFLLQVNPLPIINIAVPDTVCSSASEFTLNNIQPFGAVGTWSGTGVSGRKFDPAISPKNKQYEGPILIRFEYTNPQTGCTASDSQEILIQTQPEISILNPKPYQQCEGIQFRMNASLKWAKSMYWTSTGNGSFDNNTLASVVYTHGDKDTASAALAGNVTLTVSSVKEGVCPVIKEDIPLIIESYPQFIMPEHQVACEPANLEFKVSVLKPKNSSNLLYSWWFGNGDSLIRSGLAQPENIHYDTAKNGWYDVTLIVHNQWGAASAHSCNVRMDLPGYVRILPQPKASFTSDPPYFTFSSNPVFTFTNTSYIRWDHQRMVSTWNFDKRNKKDTSTRFNPVHIYPSDTMTYWVTLETTYLYYDLIKQQHFMCWDSTVQPRKVATMQATCMNIAQTAPSTFRIYIPFEGTLIHVDPLGRRLKSINTKGMKYADIDTDMWPDGIHYFILQDGKRHCITTYLKQ